MQTRSYTQLIADVIQRVRQVSGTSTQLYSEGVIGQYIEEGYRMLRDETWWPHLMKWIERTLDGTTGKTTVSLSAAGVTDLSDIQGVYYSNNERRLPQIGEDVNPYALGGLSARFVEPLPSDDAGASSFFFRVLPMTATGTIRIRAKTDPTGLFTTPSVVVPMEANALQNYAVWRYFTDDGANPGAAQAAIQVYERIKDRLLEKINDQPIWLDPRVSSGIDRWQEY